TRSTSRVRGFGRPKQGNQLPLMRKAGILLTAVALSVLLAVPSEASAGGTRTQKGTYDSAATGAVTPAGEGGTATCSRSHGQGCVSFKPKRTEHQVSFSITDSSGGDVYAGWCQDINRDTVCGPLQGEPGGSFCTKTAKPVAIRPGREVDVFIYDGVWSDPPCTSQSTSGTVKAAFVSS